MSVQLSIKVKVVGGIFKGKGNIGRLATELKDGPHEHWIAFRTPSMRVFQPGLKAEMSIPEIQILFSDTENAPLAFPAKYDQKPCLGQESIAHKDWKDRVGVCQPEVQLKGRGSILAAPLRRRQECRASWESNVV